MLNNILCNIKSGEKGKRENKKEDVTLYSITLLNTKSREKERKREKSKGERREGGCYSTLCFQRFCQLQSLACDVTPMLKPQRLVN